MNHKNTVIVGSIGFVLVCFLIWLWPKAELQAPTLPLVKKPTAPVAQAKVKTLPDGRPAPVDPDAAKQGVKENFGPDPDQIMAFANALMKSFSFWGKVVDQHGNPVSNASISWGANNSPDPNKSGTRGQATSDTSGMFLIKAHGIGLYVEVSKEGYHRVPTPVGAGALGSYGGFKSVGPMGNTDRPMGTKEAPAIFVLRKMGETESLIHHAECSVRLPKNGSPVEINLENGLTVGQGDLKVQCWTNDQSKNEQGHYDWKCVLTVPGGGLAERTDAFAFTAPEEGYQESITLGPPSDIWASNASRHYFARLADNRYARINLRMRTGGEHFFVIESYYNPTPGSRNLEFDPAKAIKP